MMALVYARVVLQGSDGVVSKDQRCETESGLPFFR